MDLLQKLKISLLVIAFSITMLVVKTSAAKTIKTQTNTIKIDILTDKLVFPWALAFLPDGAMLITERSGKLRIFKDGHLSSPLSGLPKVRAKGQGGLLDVAVDPDFDKNHYIYVTFSEPGDGGGGTAVARSELHGDTLKNTKIIYRQNIKSRTTRHYGSRIAFPPDGTLFISHGDRGDRPRAQDPFDHAGSLIRINKDGSVPIDNPFRDGKKALPEIWSIGHRNMQGLDIHPETGKVWTVEHGARGGDEINQPEAGKNYGWPIISYGRHYSGRKIGVGITRQGLEQPHYYWDPSIAPSSLAFYKGDLFPEWKGDIFIGALAGQLLVRLDMDGEAIKSEERLLADDYGRIRDVVSGPDGALYLLSDDEDGLLLRITPAER